jgi:hypothetical protein
MRALAQTPRRLNVLQRPCPRCRRNVQLRRITSAAFLGDCPVCKRTWGVMAVVPKQGV